MAYLTSPDSQTLNSNKEPSKVTWKVWGRFLCFYCAINPSQTKLIYFRCTCGNCQILNRNEECTCCSEFSQFCDKNREAVETGEVAEAPVCITQHPGFQAVCLNKWVLQTAWYQYKQQYSQSGMLPIANLSDGAGVFLAKKLEYLCHHVQCVALEHTWDLKITSTSRVFIFPMNKKLQVYMVTQTGCTLCS